MAPTILRLQSYMLSPHRYDSFFNGFCQVLSPQLQTLWEIRLHLGNESSQTLSALHSELEQGCSVKPLGLKARHLCGIPMKH